MSNIEDFKKSELNGLSSYDLEHDSDCPICDDGYLEFYTSEATGYDVELHGLYMGLSCPKCGYYIQVSGDINYVQRKDTNGNWLNPTDKGYNDLYDVWEWTEWSLYYDEELQAVCEEVTDSENRSIRYVCENPEFEEHAGNIHAGNISDNNTLIDEFAKNIKERFPKLPKAIINYYTNMYKYTLSNVIDKFREAYQNDDDVYGYVGCYNLDGCSSTLVIHWENMSYEEEDLYFLNYSLKEIVDDDVDDEEYPPLEEDEKQLFHQMESDIIEWLNTTYGKMPLYS